MRIHFECLLCAMHCVHLGAFYTLSRKGIDLVGDAVCKKNPEGGGQFGRQLQQSVGKVLVVRV